MKELIQKQKEAYVEELIEFLTIPSVSADSSHKDDVLNAANWLTKSLEKIGMENIELIETKGHPIVYADWLHAEGQPTILIYGHYDVQPADPLERWESPPFEPVTRNNKLYARGATDDKGQLFIHLKAIELLQQTLHTLPVNIKFCIEGEEELASPNLPPFIENHKQKLAADVVLISDTSFINEHLPAICTSLRGALAMELKVKTANADLHSGTYGGGVPNAIHSLVKILDSFHNDHGKITIEGFYEGVPEITDELRKEIASIPFDEAGMKKEIGLETLFGEDGFTFQEQTGIRPTLEINGVTGGFQGEGIKTIVPCEATAKITCRLVGNQNPQKVYEAIERHIKTNSPTGVQAEIKQLLQANPVTLDSQNVMIQKAADAYEKVYNIRPVFPKAGGSIPVVEVFSRILDIPVVLMGFGLPSENLHAPNEHFHLENFTKGIETSITYLRSL